MLLFGWIWVLGRIPSNSSIGVYCAADAAIVLVSSWPPPPAAGAMLLFGAFSAGTWAAGSRLTSAAGSLEQTRHTRDLPAAYMKMTSWAYGQRICRCLCGRRCSSSGQQVGASSPPVATYCQSHSHTPAAAADESRTVLQATPCCWWVVQCGTCSWATRPPRTGTF